MACHTLLRRMTNLTLSCSSTASRQRSIAPIVSLWNGAVAHRCLSTSPWSLLATSSIQNANPVDVTLTHRSFSQAAINSTPTKSSNPILTTNDGRQVVVFDPSRRKLKPSIVRKRIEKLKTYEGKQSQIRHSPFRLNLVCQFAAGLPLLEALQQLEFCNKTMAPLVYKVLKRTANLADIRDGLQHSQIEVAECFVTQARHMKRFKVISKGRGGVMQHKCSHIRVVLREIDFKLKIYQANSLHTKKRWIQRQIMAEQDGAKARAKREELAQLEQQVKAMENK